MIYHKLIVISALLLSHTLCGQTASFEVQETVCIGEELILGNSSIDAVRYQWDFCFESLAGMPVIDDTYTPVLGISNSEGIELIYDKGNWFGFIGDRSNGQMYLLSFGTDLSLQPSVTTIAISGDVWTTYKDIRLVKEAGNWYGLVLTIGSNIYRVDFGSEIGASLTSTNLGNLDGWSTLRGIDLMEDGSDKVAIISSWGNSKLTMLRFENTITAVPEKLTIAVGNPLINRPFGVSLIKENSRWIGLLASYSNNKLLQLDFGTDSLFSDPIISELATPTLPTSVRIVEEGGSYVSFIHQQSSGIIRYSFGESISDGFESSTNLGSLGGSLGTIYASALTSCFPTWRMLSLNSVGKLTSIVFPEGECSFVSNTSSTSPSPTGLSYDSAGRYLVELTAIHANGSIDRVRDTVTVLDQIAPDISFSTINQCISSVNTFTNSNTSGDITSYSWDFDDDGTEDSADPNPTYQFSSVGNYGVSLTVSNGSCENVTTDTVKIYGDPVAGFDLPAGATCTNTALSFTNTSIYTAGSPVNFSWDFNGDGVEDSADESPSFTYNAVGSYDVRLIIGLATGCSDTLTQQLTLEEGPAVAFSWLNNCFGEAVQFTNETTDDPSYSYSWNFGDGSPLLTTRNTSHTYASAGSYTVSLTVDDGSCTSVLAQTIVVNDQRLVSIIAGDATENAPVNFVGNDLTLAGDSIISWSWDFGGLGTASTQEASYTFSTTGSYTAILDVTTAQGCSEQVSNTVDVLVSSRPTAFFTATDDVCRGEEISLTNSSINADSYLWDFCFESFVGVTSATTLYSSPDLLNPEGVEVAYDRGFWYGFVLSRDNNKLIRLGLGSDPLIGVVDTVDLGGLGVLSSPRRLKLVEDSGNWYGVLINANSLVVMDFGSSLINTPTITNNLGNLDSWSNLRGLEVLQLSTGDWYVIASDANLSKVTSIRFGSSLTNVPSGSDISTIITGNPEVSGNQGIGLVEHQGKVYGLLASSGESKLLHLAFENGLLLAPTITSLSTLSTVRGVDMVIDGNNYVGVVSGGSKLYTVDFGNYIDKSDSALITDQLVNGQLSSVYDISLVKYGSGWLGYTIGQSSKTVSVVAFEESCSALQLTSSTSPSPTGLSYDSAGRYLVELTAIHANGSIDRVRDTVTVLDQTAPDISFSTINQCTTNINTFTTSNTSDDITSYSWNFGDESPTSTEESPTHQFSEVGTYKVRLTISNGTCSNSTNQDITIYPEPPIPSTTFASVNNCANSEITVRNQTDTTGFGAAITYLYSFTGQKDSITNVHQLVYQFATSGEKILTVRSIIPGCESEVFRDTVTIIAAPLLDFSANTVCEGDLTSFTNNSEGSQFLWDFGDGFTSTDKVPVHLYENTGSYMMELEASNELGCTSRETREVLVNALPQADFEYDLVCEDDRVILRDVSIVEGADILAWEWYMSDELVSNTDRAEVVFNNISQQTITLIVTASNNCSSTITQNLEILAKPEIDFDIQLSCIGSESLFRDLSAGDALISRNWFVDGQALSSNEAQLSYTFPDSGDYVVALSIVNENLCATTLSKSIRVLPEPILNFQSMNGCQSEELSIVDLSVSMEDPIISRRWILDDEVVGNGSQIFLSDLTVGVKALTLEVTTEQGCNYSMNQPMEIFESSIASFEVSTDFGVPPFNIDLLNTSQSATTFMWYLNDSLFSTAANPQIAILEEGGYNIQLVSTNADGCLDTVQTAINAAIPLMDLSIRNLTFEEDFIFLELTNSGNLPVAYIDYTVSLANEFSFEQRYSQRVDDGQTVVLKIDLNFPKSPDFICISVKSPYGTEDLNPEDNEICINIKQQPSIGLPFPNPARDFSQIRFVIPEVDRMTISLVDLSGQVKYFEEYSSAVAGLNVFYIDLTSVRPGTYFFLIKYKGDTFQSRIIKQ